MHMPQVKEYTAKRELRLDCGHTVQAGDTYAVTSVFTCKREGSWPRRILMACFDVARRKQTNTVSAKPDPVREDKQGPKPSRTNPA